MIERCGNIGTEIGKAQLILVTTNAIVRNGRLVMGAGSALWAQNQWPHLPEEFAEQLLQSGKVGRFYGLLLARTPAAPETQVGAFQTKFHYRESSTLALIGYSTNLLVKYLDEHPEVKRVALTFPGVKNGGLTKEEVRPIIEKLPDKVLVYHLEPLPSKQAGLF